MREASRDKGRLSDIVEYAKHVEHFIDGFTFEEFRTDTRTYFAVMKSIEVIGEAAYMLTKEFKEEHSELPWPQIVAMRHILVHGYAQVRIEDLWETAINDIVPLRIQVEKYLGEI